METIWTCSVSYSVSVLIPIDGCYKGDLYLEGAFYKPSKMANNKYLLNFSFLMDEDLTWSNEQKPIISISGSCRFIHVILVCLLLFSNGIKFLSSSWQYLFLEGQLTRGKFSFPSWTWDEHNNILFLKIRPVWIREQEKCSGIGVNIR